MYFIINIYAPINNIKNKEDIKKDVGKLNFSNKAEILYKIHEKNINKRIKLFDSVFVKNNKDNLSVEINGKQIELNEYYINDNNEEVLKVTLKELPNKSLTDMSYMFNNCKNLVSVDFSNWKTDNIISIEAMFQLCPLKEIPDISNFNTQNLENIRAMFCKCINLKSIPDMNKWFINKDNFKKYKHVI